MGEHRPDDHPPNADRGTYSARLVAIDADAGHFDATIVGDDAGALRFFYDRDDTYDISHPRTTSPDVDMTAWLRAARLVLDQRRDHHLTIVYLESRHGGQRIFNLQTDLDPDELNDPDD